VIRYRKYGAKASWIVKRNGNYGRKVSRIVERYGQCVRKASWNVKWYAKYGKYRRELWNDMKIQKKGKSNSNKIWTI
jgi:hypothetical protein